MANNRLYNHPCERRGQPEQGKMLNIRTECLKNTGRITVLQGKPKLNAQEAKAHIDNLCYT